MTQGTGTLGRAYVETYGCQMNIADGELMEGILEAGGYEVVDRPEDADVILVNTCAIREHAERRVIGRVGQLWALKRARPEVILGVTGCMAQRMGRDLLGKAPQVDLVLGPDAYRSLPDRLAELRAETTSATERQELGPKRRLQLAVLDLDEAENYEGLESRRRSGASAWVPIQRGCDHRCTFCIVPYVRGPEKNRAPSDVLNEVRVLAEGGVTEVTLLGQTVNSYASGEWDFTRLLRDVARTDGIRRVRFTSPHPNDVTAGLIEVMATEPAVCEQLHLPVQSGSDRILRRMARKYTTKKFLETVARVRAAIPDVALSTDVIVGFPGESDAEFEETMDLMQYVRFDDAYTYKYSTRDGTPATRFPAADFLPDRVAQARLEVLIEVAREIQNEINALEVGRTEEVMIDGAGRFPGDLRGRTRRGKVVVFPEAVPSPEGGETTGESVEVGEYVSVRLTATTGPTFQGLRATAALAAT